MKSATFIFCVISVLLGTARASPNPIASPEPEPFFGFIGDLAQGILNTGAGLVKGVVDVGANILGGIANFFTGILGGAVGGVLNGVLKLGVGGRINVDPNKGGCQAENVAKIVSGVFQALHITVQTCKSNADCFGVNTGQCGLIPGNTEIGTICKLTL